MDTPNHTWVRISALSIPEAWFWIHHFIAGFAVTFGPYAYVDPRGLQLLQKRVHNNLYVETAFRGGFFFLPALHSFTLVS